MNERSQEGFLFSSTAPAPADIEASVQVLEQAIKKKKEKSVDPRTWDDSEIYLSDSEREVFDLLVDVVRYFGLHTQLRVAGGWVRDKILGCSSPDIDIALDNMLGVEFAMLVRQYLLEHGLESNAVGVIHSNPDQSKHLETACLKVLGASIDFVNLRCEEYSSNSRIPAMTLGTAEEDAFRRDLTINALFFNISTKRIEDMTGKGLRHLQDQVICTPLPPRVTLLEDPLRVLRAIRFASRLGFNLHPDLEAAIRLPEVHSALEKKVSRERVGIEVNAMLSGPYPVRALRLICDLNLFRVVFPLPPNNLSKKDDDVELKRQSTRLASIVESLLLEKRTGLDNEYEETEDQKRMFRLRQRLMLLAAFLSLQAPQIYLNTRHRKASVVQFMLQDDLRMSAKDSTSIWHLIQSSRVMRDLVNSSAETSCLTRLEAGLTLRTVGGMWRDALDLAMAQELLEAEEEDQLESDALSKRVKDVRRKYLSMLKALETYNLGDVWELKPLFDGQYICTMLQVRPGPFIGRLLQDQIEWQLVHPQCQPQQMWHWLTRHIATVTTHCSGSSFHNNNSPNSPGPGSISPANLAF